MKILINVPSFKLLGGVANHYMGLRPYWTERVKYNTVGNRTTKAGGGIYWLPWDVLKFIIQLLIFRPNIVLLNPSLGENALKRDFIFLKIAHFFKFKVAIFIHGFNLEYANIVDGNWVVKNLNKASLLFVLANDFKNKLQEWGVTKPIFQTTTKVDDRLIENFNIDKKNYSKKNILFLARVERAKGVFIALETYSILKPLYPNLTLTIAGDGSALEDVQHFVSEKSLKDVEITGRVYGQELINLYSKATLSSSSSSHGEGLPTSVLEAMAFGLPIITRNVGGLPDFFENGKMGYISDSLDPNEIAKAMELYIKDTDLTKQVGYYNHNFAKKHFLASNVALQIENTLKNELLH